MPAQRTLLLADPDPGATRRLGAALRTRGHRVLTVRDGSKALEVAVMRVPDVVLYDAACPLLDPKTFSEILRANPRTARIPVVVVGGDEQQERARGIAFLQKPFNVDEVLARIEQIFRRARTAADVRREGSLKGTLGEVGLLDLLQMLSLNRSSGTVHLEGREGGLIPGGTAELVLREGRIVDARTEEVSATKALYRVLGWSHGTFSFAPGMPSGPGRIQASMDEVLLEGMRHVDEIRSLEGRAPAREAVLALSVDLAHLPEGLHPVTEEILGLLDLFRTCGEVVDNARATDLEALRALTTLVERGMVRVLGRASGESGGRRLVAPDVAFALHGRHAARQAVRRQASLRVVLAVSHPRRLRELVGELAEVTGFHAQPAGAALETGLGEVGSLVLTEALQVVLTALPAGDELSPLWRPFGAGAIGGVVAAEADEAERLGPLVAHLAALGRPLALVGARAGLEALAGPQAFPAGTVTEGLARVLERVARLR